MPSPFPGMDPYLEGALWTTFHFAFGVNYTSPPEPALDEVALSVADSLLRTAGLRPA
jgi:hypothetical protein